MKTIFINLPISITLMQKDQNQYFSNQVHKKLKITVMLLVLADGRKLTQFFPLMGII
jgi:hypothetical protein